MKNLLIKWKSRTLRLISQARQHKDVIPLSVLLLVNSYALIKSTHARWDAMLFRIEAEGWYQKATNSYRQSEDLQKNARSIYHQADSLIKKFRTKNDKYGYQKDQ